METSSSGGFLSSETTSDIARGVLETRNTDSLFILVPRLLCFPPSGVRMRESMSRSHAFSVYEKAWLQATNALLVCRVAVQVQTLYECDNMHFVY